MSEAEAGGSAPVGRPQGSDTILTNRFSDIVVRWIFKVLASFTLLVVGAIFFFVAREALPFLGKEGVSPLLETTWLPVSFQERFYGLLPLINGSLLVTGVAGLIAVPLGVLAAAYIAEIARPAEREILKPFIELLASIPSVVLGFFGLVTVAPAVKNFFGLDSGLTAVTGAIVLALMAVPTIISVSEDAIRAVPDAYRQASLALGASRQQTLWGVLVPAALPGITAAVMLGFGRIIGETMAVLMVTGNTPRMTWYPFEAVRTMTATIAAEMGEVAFGSVHYHALFMVGVVLLVLTFLLNVAALYLFRSYGSR